MKNYNFTQEEKQTIRNFIHSIDKSIKVRVSQELRFECDIEKRTIYLGSKKIDKKENKLFQEWFRQQPEYIKINKTLMSILHEIGHFMTFNKQEFEIRNETEEMLMFMYENYYINEKEINFGYWNIANERKATMWGVDYFKNNQEKCRYLAAALGIDWQ